MNGDTREGFDRAIEMCGDLAEKYRQLAKQLESVTSEIEEFAKAAIPDPVTGNLVRPRVLTAVDTPTQTARLGRASLDLYAQAAVWENQLDDFARRRNAGAP